jgi:hypothetical protein
MSARPNFELRLLGKRPRRHVIFSFRKDSASPSLAASWPIMHSDHRKFAMKPYEEARRPILSVRKEDSERGPQELVLSRLDSRIPVKDT